METKEMSGNGVQALVNRIRDEGVSAGQSEADELIKSARQEAANIVAQAQSEAAELKRATTAEIDSEKASADAALHLAARDVGLELQSRITQAFDTRVRRLVSETLQDEALLKAMILVLAGHAVDEHIQDKTIHVLAKQALFDESPNEDTETRAALATLGIASDMLRDGVTLVPSSDIQGGVRVQVVDDQLELDLTSDSVSRLMVRYLLPKFRTLLLDD